MILLIDNYDSFVYNLYQMIGALGEDIRVMRNDQISLSEITQWETEKIILSPGPGKPEDTGICPEVIRHFAGKVDILGVCLGHQAIFEAFGGVVSHAKSQMHGKQSRVRILEHDPLFCGLDEEILVARYHSLAAKEDTLPGELMITAVSEDDEIMAIKHRELSIYGLQFHPESILTPGGNDILKNFLAINRRGRHD